MIRIFCVFAMARATLLFLAPDLSSLGCRWDCNFYLDIANSGYDLLPEMGSGKANWAFFPIYPMLIRLLGGSILAGVIISNLAIIAGTYFGCQYLQKTRPDASTLPFVILCAAGPNSFYFTTVYTEALFFGLACLTLYAWQQDRPLGAGVVVAVLSATRAVGVFFVVGLVADVIQKRRPIDSTVVLTVVLCPLGFFAYMAWLHYAVGDAFAFSHVQIAWGRKLAEPIGQIIGALAKPDLSKIVDTGRQSHTYNALWAMLAIMMVIHLFRRRRYDEAVIGTFCIGIPLMMGITSTPRFVIGCPIFAFVACDWLNRLRPAATHAILAAAVAVNLWLVWEWIGNAQFLV